MRTTSPGPMTRGRRGYVLLLAIQASEAVWITRASFCPPPLLSTSTCYNLCRPMVFNIDPISARIVSRRDYQGCLTAAPARNHTSRLCNVAQKFDHYIHMPMGIVSFIAYRGDQVFSQTTMAVWEEPGCFIVCVHRLQTYPMFAVVSMIVCIYVVS
jgi:hypothetical protein